MNFPEILTLQEQEEFTAVNMLAHNVLREQSTAKQPCWLCMSNEAKEEARILAASWFNGNKYPIAPVRTDSERSLAQFERQIAPILADMLQQWVDAEAEYKRLRVEEHNPVAYFAP